MGCEKKSKRVSERESEREGGREREREGERERESTVSYPNLPLSPLSLSQRSFLVSLSNGKRYKTIFSPLLSLTRCKKAMVRKKEQESEREREGERERVGPRLRRGAPA